MTDASFMRVALTLARRGYGTTSPNPMVGAVLVQRGKIIGRGWHHRAGEPHAEIEALREAEKKGRDPKGATLYVTLEPCCTHGRTPPCTAAIIAAGIKRVVVGATDPNPKHAGKGFTILKRAGMEVVHGVLEPETMRLNEAFNHWIVHGTPFVTVKAAMTLDGKIATASGESKWITGERARAHGMKLRQGSDAILVGINTLLADDPSLTFREVPSAFVRQAGLRRDESLKFEVQSPESNPPSPRERDFGATRVESSPRRIILDSKARTPLSAKVVTDELRHLTTVVVTKAAPASRVKALGKRVQVLVAPLAKSKDRLQPPQIDLRWLMNKLGAEKVTSVLVEGGGEVNASFLLAGLAQRVAFFYAPKVLGGRDARKGVAGAGVRNVAEMIRLRAVEWKRLGPDLRLTALLASKQDSSSQT